MRLFALSDIHTDYQENKDWVFALSDSDYKEDVLILAGDISADVQIVEKTLRILKDKFLQILFVIGNHDLWINSNENKTSLEKLELIENLTADLGVITDTFHYEDLSVIPLHSWYDYSFGEPGLKLKNSWMDYFRCKWPKELNEEKITKLFLSKNQKSLSITNKKVVTFSHFLPRIDLMPFYIPSSKRFIYPVLGTTLLEKQIREIKPLIHVYGHSHVNVDVKKNQIRYINNAFGYPHESNISAKKLCCIIEV